MNKKVLLLLLIPIIINTAYNYIKYSQYSYKISIMIFLKHDTKIELFENITKMQF